MDISAAFGNLLERTLTGPPGEVHSLSETSFRPSFATWNFRSRRERFALAKKFLLWLADYGLLKVSSSI
jgi:hypothetical protein